ncbi:hypothetical protein C0J52_03013 [Blattella germanica]|nr:hypothetical protein C0J52_03013 [Blattella germanica]
MSFVLEVFPLQDRLEDLKKLGDLIVQETLKYAKDTMEHLTIAFVAYICLCITLYFVTAYLKFSPHYGHLPAVKRVLFVTAHPDDECMFFGPIILKLAQKNDCQLFLLCLSEGNYHKEGIIRRKELWKSCEILGIPDSNITLCKSSFLPDDPSVRWREDIVANVLLNHIEALSIDTKLPPYCKAYALESINTLRKYSAMLDIPISYLLSSFWYIISLRERSILKTAMAAHQSQYVWFRKLYMIFSRYTIVNTFKEIEIVDLELDLELDD